MGRGATRYDPTAGRVMASIDAERGVERLIIADVSRDDAWIAMPVGDAPHLTDWL